MTAKIAKPLLSFLSKKPVYQSLLQSQHGLEKECLRVDKNGKISSKPHPLNLGHKLTHPHISTDFAEAQLELITPPFSSLTKTHSFLQKLHHYLHQQMPNEWLWPSSMPPPVENWEAIKEADFGSSNQGRKKKLYRIGLTHRFGKAVQTISGCHYNLSFSEDLFKHLYRQSAKKAPSLRAFTDAKYFGLIRNFLRYGCVSTYLFGSTPHVHQSFVNKPSKKLLLRNDSYTLPYSCSFRSSQWGYYSRVQMQNALNFNSLEKYLHSLHYAIHTTHPSYEKIGRFTQSRQPKQLNTNILQIENEHYSRIRPKALLKGQSPYEALKNRGVSYVEIRAIDLDPMEMCGVSLDQLRFLYLLSLYCLLIPSPSLSKGEELNIPKIQNLVALKGRDPKLRIHFKGKKQLFSSFANSLIEALFPLAKLLDSSGSQYQDLLKTQQEKILNPHLTPSHALTESKQSFFQLYLKQAKTHKKMATPLGDSAAHQFSSVVKSSILENRALEVYDEMHLKGFEDQELSTQLIIKEALSRDISLEFIDRKEGFLQLVKGRKKKLIKQATKTSLDSYLSYLVMENKEVSKFVLKEKGVRVPKGYSAGSLDEARALYPFIKGHRLVVKPLTTNFGVGISFVEKGKKTEFDKAVTKGLRFSHAVIIEEFIKGKEYRFLVINDQLIAVCHRDPANVVGDGKKSISVLIKEKNQNPESYKTPDHYIKLGKLEKALLKKQGLSPSSILSKGKKIYLRENSNICTGGDPINMTEVTHESYKKLAIQAAQSAEAKICGVDMMIENPKRAANSRNYAVIEINFNPALYMHAFPFLGEKVNVAAPILKALGF